MKTRCVRALKLSERPPPDKVFRLLPATLGANPGYFGATDARKCGATSGATRAIRWSMNAVAMQENPAGSTILLPA
ncbi:hypothetical protein [Paraburkholderia sp.]|uniref:hypothetical protein n=1 Tax=Paraburkholderia sp. TaxID=1926495 RepID=UPI0025E2A8A9|nr:hypothetical protein [Paraburkholderia sp.]